MKNLIYKLALLAIIAGLSLFTDYAHAGNLEVKFRLQLPDNIEYEDETEVQLDVENINPSFAVTGIIAQLKIRLASESGYLYEFEDDEIDDLPPEEKFSYNFGSLPWSKLEIGKSYVAEYSFDADYDADTTNNKVKWNFFVDGNYVLRTFAVSQMIIYLGNNYHDNPLQQTIAYIPDNILQSGTRLSLAYDASDEIELDKPYWVGFVDFSKYGLYSHSTSLLLMDAETGEIEEKKGNWYPRVNDTSFGAIYDLDLSRFYGEIPKGAVQSEDDYIYQINNTPAGDERSCVLLVTGKPSSPRDDHAFRTSARTMRNEFENEELGPQISSEDVFELNNPTAEQLYNQIQDLSGQYDNITFYYMGHADQYAGIDLNDFNYGFFDLLNVLCGTDLTNITIIMDCCYSGQMVSELDNISEDLKDGKNITIFTSGDSESESRLRELDYELRDGSTLETGIGAFTNSLATSFGNPDADTDGDGATSWKEAFEDALERNPLINEGSDARLNDQNPQQGSFESVPETEDGEVSFRQSGLNIKINSGLDLGYTFNVDVSYGSDLFEQPEDPDIIEASAGRLFDIKLKDNDGAEFDVDLEFKYNQFYDNFESNEGQYGIIYRESPGDMWMIHEPVEFNEQTMLIRALGVKHFSQWALARVDQANPVEFNNDGSIFVQLYPNPFNETFTVDLSIEEAGDVNLEILDLSGIIRESLDAGYHGPGSYKFMFDGSNFDSGIYLIRISAGSKFYIKRLVHVK